MSGVHVAAKAARKRERISDPADFLALLTAAGAAATTLRSYTSVFSTFRPWFTAAVWARANTGRSDRERPAGMARRAQAPEQSRGDHPPPFFLLALLSRCCWPAGSPGGGADGRSRGPPRPDEGGGCTAGSGCERERRRGVRRATDMRDEALLKLLVEAGLARRRGRRPAIALTWTWGHAMGGPACKAKATGTLGADQCTRTSSAQRLSGDAHAMPARPVREPEERPALAMQRPGPSSSASAEMPASRCTPISCGIPSPCACCGHTRPTCLRCRPCWGIATWPRRRSIRRRRRTTWWPPSRDQPGAPAAMAEPDCLCRRAVAPPLAASWPCVLPW